MYLLTQNKNGTSALSPHRQLGMSYNTARLLKHNLMQTMIECFHDWLERSGPILRPDLYGEIDCVRKEKGIVIEPCWKRASSAGFNRTTLMALLH